MKIKAIKKSNIYYDALIYLYNQATKDMGDDPTDDIELAFETLDKGIEKLENFQRTLKARIDMNKSITKDDIKVDEITLAQLDAENSLCNLLLVLLEVDE